MFEAPINIDIVANRKSRL